MEYFITILKVIFIGIVEGITEWLPISSTGHMIIFDERLGLSTSKDFGTNFWNLFLVVIQLGAILAVLIVFIKKIRPWGASKSQKDKTKTWLLLLNILIACIPAAIFGFLLDDIIDSYLFNFITVSITLIVYGVIFILIEYLLKRNNKQFIINDIYKMTWQTALIIGFAQVLSLIPGTSRSGITIIAALAIGMNRKSAAEFSFLVSIPIMFGASGFKTIKYFTSGNSLTGIQGVYLLIGCIVAFFISILTIKYFMKFINKNSFTVFGIYRIVLGIVLILYFVISRAIAEPSTIENVLSYLQYNKNFTFSKFKLLN